MKSSYRMPFTKEDINTARETNIVSYLENAGIGITKEGKKYILTDHDSCVIDPNNNMWFWNSRNKFGRGAIDFVMEYYGCDFTAAVGKLIGNSSVPISSVHSVKEKTPNKSQFKLTPANSDYRRVYAYLTKSRGINAKVITHFVKQKKLYEDRNHNCVFVGYDNEQKPASAAVRGTLTDVKYRGNLSDSDKSCGFCHRGTNDKLYIFEAAIDMMSYMSLYPDYENHYLAIGGLADNALENMLSLSPDIRRLIFCLDCDVPGIYATHIYLHKYGDKYDCSFKITDPAKDWNDFLLQKGGGKASCRYGSDNLVVFHSQHDVRKYLADNYAASNSLLLLPSENKEAALDAFCKNYSKQRGKEIKNIRKYETNRTET